MHALTDMISDVTTLATISYSLRPATARFPMGYGKIESLGALGVSGLLLSGGLMIGLQAFLALAQQFTPDIAHMLAHLGIFEHVHHHGHSHGPVNLGPNINAAWLAGGSIVIKEWLYRATMKIAKSKRSGVLASNAYHHRVDSLTAFVALLTISTSHFITSAQWLDPVGGLIISGMVVQAGWYNTKNALLELADVGMDTDIKLDVQNAVTSVLRENGVLESSARVTGVQGIKSGQNFLIEVEVPVPSGWTVSQTEEVEVALRKTIGAKVRGARKVNVRFTSNDKQGPAFADQFVTGRSDHQKLQEHDSGHDHHGHTHPEGVATDAKQDKTDGSLRSPT